MSKVLSDPSKVSVPAIASIPPEVPRGPASESDLKWKRQKMTRWLSPTQLAATGVRAVLSSVFGAYADRREVQAALHQLDTAGASSTDPDTAHFDGLVFRYEDRSDPEHGFWIDFVADLGDGFDSTYTVAWLLGQPSLPLPAGDQKAAVDGRVAMGPGRTRRGNLLVMGGDQVYPTASRDEYANRLAGPYEAALPWSADAPHLFAIPGNHDWYDGLTSFMRLFCQQRWLGAWKTQQHRSYFALQLPERWWLLGVDVQLESDIDQPQIEYFCRVSQRMQPGDRVILVTAEPVWVHTPTEPAAFDNLAFFEKTVLAPHGAELALTLTGDLHHYSRYSSVEREGELKHHKITAGGGGAYLLGTQILDDHILLTPPEAQPRGPAPRVEQGGKERYDRKCVYPSAERSLMLKLGSLRAGLKNPSFAVFMGLVYTLYAWFLQSASETSAIFPTSFMGEARSLGPGDWTTVAGYVWVIAAHEPLVMAFSLLMLGAFIAFCGPDVERSRLLRQSKWLQTVMKVGIGGAHGLAHLSLAVSLLWLVAVVDLGPGDLTNTESPTQAALFAIQMLLIGAPLGALLMGIFLLPYVNYNEAFSSQHLEEYKNFVRLHLQPDGRVTVYPYGVDDPARWRFHPEAEPGTPYFDPEKAPEVRLLDGPIVLAAPATLNSASEEAVHGD